MKPITDVLVVGGDFQGLLAAINLKAKLPQLRVQVLRHPVKDDFSLEGFAVSTAFLDHIHGELGIGPADFVRAARPTWRLGTRYEWGPRDFFDHTHEFQIDSKYGVLSREAGFYVGPSPRAFESLGLASALMSAGRACLRGDNGQPQLQPGRFSYHLEHQSLQRSLENLAAHLGVTIRDGEVSEVIRSQDGIASLKLSNGESLAADLFVDATGLQSLLLGQGLNEPFSSFAPSLSCDSAVVATYPTVGALIQPHTSVRTMDAGWSWRTEHERFAACGYAFSSHHIQSEEAISRLREIYPNCGLPRLLRFEQGRREHCWVGNVIGVGNASFFLEPLGCDGLGILAFQCQWLAQSLIDCDGQLRASLIKQFNKRFRRLVEGQREFLGLFYRYNTRLQTPFWEEARRHAHFGALEPIVQCYQELGPDSLHRSMLLFEADPIGMEGYFSVLVGQNVPWGNPWRPTEDELAKWQIVHEGWRRKAAGGFSVNQIMQLFLQRPATQPPQAARRATQSVG